MKDPLRQLLKKLTKELRNLPNDLAGSPGAQALIAIGELATYPKHIELIPDHCGGKLVFETPISLEGERLLSAINTYFDGADHRNAFQLRQWARTHGFDDLQMALVTRGLTEAMTQIIEVAAELTKRACMQMMQLRGSLTQSLMERDQPATINANLSLDDDAQRWLLAEGASGARRSEILTRRFQALSLFGHLRNTLMTLEITKVVDEGAELVPAFATKLNVTANLIRASAGAPHENEYQVIRTLHMIRDHRIPRHEWPDQAPDGWASSPLVKSQPHDWVRAVPIIRYDYRATSTTSDAVKAAIKDLINPVVREKGIAMRLSPNGNTVFHRGLDDVPQSATGDNLLRWQELIACVHRALIGTRKVKAFAEAAEIWHRRSASIAALRHAHNRPEKGWPVLCKPWASKCGTWSIVCLGSAQDLVDEGSAHGHCVGGYYSQCRSGKTAILSLRKDGSRELTIEILVTIIDKSEFSLTVGQVEGNRRRGPSESEKKVIIAFMRDLNTGAHPLNTIPVTKHIAKMKKYEGWIDEEAGIDMEFARSVFPLYQPLLPKPRYPSYDAWCNENGITDAITRLAESITTPQPAPSQQVSL